MQNFWIQDNAIAGFGFFDEREQPAHLHTDTEIFYVLEGEVDFAAGNERFRLGDDDFLVVNPGLGHGHTASLNALYACLHINYHELCRRLGTVRVLFACNTTTGRTPHHAELQTLLRKIASRYNVSPQRGSLYLEGLYYHLLDALTGHFLVETRSAVPDARAAEEGRVGEILGYIRNNYRNPLTLDELAEKLFLSPSYLSKYIKKRFGMNFSDYLSSVRLAHAVEEMQTTHKSITRIVLDNGFPNAASFNRVFKARYGTTPSAWAEKVRPKARGAAVSAAATRQLSAKVQSYLEGSAQAAPDGTALRFVADARLRHSYPRSWNRMINIGLSSDLFNSDMREHLILMKRELGIEYVRFWDLYSPVLFLDIEPGQSNYNFTKLDRLFDFLTDNGLRPYIELGFKPILLLRSVENGEDYMVSQEREILFETPADYGRFVAAFISHYAGRYGLEEVEQWCFEQWVDPRQTERDDYTGYFGMFEAAARALKAASPHIRIGGGGLSASRGDYRGLLNAWHRRTLHPDFISIYCYPYATTAQSRAHSDIRGQIAAIRDAADEAGFETPALHVSEWNFTVSDRNTLNDSCFKGAYILKNVLESMRQVELMGYWSASDLLSEFTDTNLILNGSGGLISRDGIKKPAYHAFSFLNRMGRYLLLNEGPCAVTTNGHDNYAMVCHNYQPPNFKYFLKADDALDIREHANLFESDEKLRIQVQIDGVKNGLYTIKTHSVSANSGSVQDEWLRMGLVDSLNKQEIDYLRQICVPRISMRGCEVRDGVLIVDTTLVPQEIQYIHLTYRREA